MPEPLDLPSRPQKPRASGLTMVIDNGLPGHYFADAIEGAARYIDIVKFGWGTALVTDHLRDKIDCLHDHGIRFCFGGTLFEKFLVQHRFESFLEFCHTWGCDLVEISNGTIPLSNTEKAAYIRKSADQFPVVSEVGLKDAVASESLTATDWIDSIGEDLDAGAAIVIAEARESGKSGICRPDGQLRTDVVEQILASGVELDHMLFEAPTKDLQVKFVTMLGPNVNLGNVAPADVIGLETLRLGLRADTLLHFEAASLYA